MSKYTSPKHTSSKHTSHILACANNEDFPHSGELPSGGIETGDIHPASFSSASDRGLPDGFGNAEALDGNIANGSFIIRQRRLTELAKELSSPERHDVLPLVVGVSDLESDTVSIHIPEKAPEDVIETLFGFTAPPSWDGLIVVAHGRAYSDGEEEDHVTIGYGLGINGEEVSVLHRKTELLVSTLPAEGRVLDCCRRAFGLSTPPAQEGIVELFIAAWLGRIFRAAGGDTSDWGDEANKQVRSLESIATLDWSSLAKLHPLIEDSDVLSPEDVGSRAWELCQRGSWSRLRGAVATGEMPHSSITSEQAAWMDDSMFARWCLAAFPDRDELTDRLGEMLPTELHREVLECLEEQRN